MGWDNANEIAIVCLCMHPLPGAVLYLITGTYCDLYNLEKIPKNLIWVSILVQDENHNKDLPH